MLSYGVLCVLAVIFRVSDGLSLFNHHKRPSPPAAVADPTIFLSHVLFRHGNRTPELSELYPNDPYLNETYFPLGRGQLTNSGKRREFSIGADLRERYDNFLGQYYTPDILETRSTDRNRTKMSLLLVLASLFPPKCQEVWNGRLNWQPIPINYVPEKDDSVLYGISCPTYLKLYDEVQASPELQAEFSVYQDNFSYIAEHSGLNITSYYDIYNLYFGLSTEEEYGFRLPTWTEKVWPDFINLMAFKQYTVYTRTTDLKKMAAGYLLQKIIDDTEDRINNKTEKKIYLYSAHENNIGQLLATLDLFETNHVPTYGSYLIFEAHCINKTYGFKIYYQNYSTPTPKLLKLAACEEFCPLNTFKSLVEEYLPEDGLCGN